LIKLNASEGKFSKNIPSGVFENFVFTVFEEPRTLLPERSDGMPEVEVRT